MSSRSPRQRRHEKTKQEILQTALGLIKEVGFENLSLREIARRVDYSPAGLYEYFDSKEGIIQALSNEGNRQLLEVLSSIQKNQSRSVTCYLVEMCLAYIDFALHKREYFTLMSNLPSERTTIDEPVRADSPYAVYLETVQAAIAGGEIQIRENFGPEEITYSLWAFVHGMATLRLTHLMHFHANFEPVNRLSLELYLASLA